MIVNSLRHLKRCKIKLKFWFDLGVILLTLGVIVLMCIDQRAVWPLKLQASRLLKQSDVRDLSGFLTVLSSIDPSMFSQIPPQVADGEVVSPNGQLIAHLERLAASGNAPARLMLDPTNRKWLEVSGLATSIETSEGLMWIGRVTGYHGPITVFAIHGEILEVAWTAEHAMRLWAGREWIPHEQYTPYHNTLTPVGSHE